MVKTLASRDEERLEQLLQDADRERYISHKREALLKEAAKLDPGRAAEQALSYSTRNCLSPEQLWYYLDLAVEFDERVKPEAVKEVMNYITHVRCPHRHQLFSFVERIDAWGCADDRQNAKPVLMRRGSELKGMTSSEIGLPYLKRALELDPDDEELRQMIDDWSSE